jgi:hypothetical protein
MMFLRAEPRRCGNEFGILFAVHQHKGIVMQERSFEILVHGVPYQVSASPYVFNTETRYSVRYNGSEEHIFTWDSSLGRLAPIDDEAATMPDDLEVAIAERLQSGR